MPIYRGYTINNEGDQQHPIKVYENGIKVYACNSEDEAYAFINRTKRELHLASLVRDAARGD